MAATAEAVSRSTSCGDQRARPRPLAVLLQAGLVDVDDHHRPELGLARLDHLVEVEAAQPQFLDRDRIPITQRQKREQQHEADAAPQTKASGGPGQSFQGWAHAWITFVGAII